MWNINNYNTLWRRPITTSLTFGVIVAGNGDSNEISEECAIPEFGAPKAVRKLWG